MKDKHVGNAKPASCRLGTGTLGVVPSTRFVPRVWRGPHGAAVCCSVLFSPALTFKQGVGGLTLDVPVCRVLETVSLPRSSRSLAEQQQGTGALGPREGENRLGECTCFA